MPTINQLVRPLWKSRQLLPHLPKAVHVAGMLKALDVNLVPGSRYRWTRGIQKTCEKYLSQRFSMKNRLEILFCHYRHGLSGLLGVPQAQCLFRHDVPGASVMLVLGRSVNDEGESVLEYSWNGRFLFRLTFSIVPGKVLDGAPGDYLFIGGSQGARDCADLIRDAALSHGDISPMAVTFLGAQALARRLGLAGIAATSAGDCVAACLKAVENHPLYDGLWQSLGGEDRGWHYFFPVEPQAKDLSLVSAHHRRRARKKQEVKRSLFAAMVGFTY